MNETAAEEMVNFLESIDNFADFLEKYNLEGILVLFCNISKQMEDDKVMTPEMDAESSALRNMVFHLSLFLKARTDYRLAASTRPNLLIS